MLAASIAGACRSRGGVAEIVGESQGSQIVGRRVVERSAFRISSRRQQRSGRRRGSGHQHGDHDGRCSRMRRGDFEATRRAKACLRHLEEPKSLNRRRQRPEIFWTSHTVRGVFDLTQQPPAMTPCHCLRRIDGTSPQGWGACRPAAKHPRETGQNRHGATRWERCHLRGWGRSGCGCFRARSSILAI